jgi:hypothetical protein
VPTEYEYQEKIRQLEFEAAENKRTIANIWRACKLETYEQCKPLPIWDHVAALRNNLLYVFTGAYPTGGIVVAEHMRENDPKKYAEIAKQLWPPQV